MITATMLLLSLLNDSLLDHMFRKHSEKSMVRKVVGEKLLEDHITFGYAKFEMPTH